MQPFLVTAWHGADVSDMPADVKAIFTGSELKLAKGDDKESAVEGILQAVLIYGLDAREVKSVRAVVEGDYLYRLRGTLRMPLVAVVEPRPE